MEYSRRLMAALRSETDRLEQLSVDEAWLNWQAYGFDSISAMSLRAHVRDATGLSVSVGVAPTKLLAKMATEAAKATSDRVLVVTPEGVQAFLQPLPVESLWGVGPKTANRLRSLGLETVGAIAAASIDRLQDSFGPRHGRILADHSRGLDESQLHAPVRAPKASLPSGPFLWTFQIGRSCGERCSISPRALPNDSNGEVWLRRKWP